MKNLFTLILTSLIITSINAQVISDTITLGSSWANDIFYSIENGGEAGTADNTSWSVGISPASQSSSIIINGGRGVALWEVPADTMSPAEFENSLDTTGAVYLQWTRNFDEDSSWTADAFSKNATGPNPPPPATATSINFGWGDYILSNQQVLGARVYLLQTPNDDFYKVFVESKIQGTTKFRYASLDHSFDTTMTVVGNDFSSKSYVYIDMDNHEILDREPARNDWDLLFTRIQPDQTLPPPGNSFSRTGALSNTINLSANPGSPNIQGVSVAMVEEFNVNDADYNDAQFSGNRNVIANRFQFTTMGSFSVYDTLGFFIQDRNENIYKFWFTGMNGGNPGNFNYDIPGNSISFNYEKVFDAEEEEEDPNSISNASENIDFHTIYPNPANDRAHLLFKAKDLKNNLQVSVYSITGKLVESVNVQTQIGLNTISLNTSNYQSGMYIVQIHNGNEVVSQKLIVNQK